LPPFDILAKDSELQIKSPSSLQHKKVGSKKELLRWYTNREYNRNREYENSSIENDLLKIGRVNHAQGQQNPDEKKKKKKDEERRRGLGM
jgi:hypothetical protein